MVPETASGPAMTCQEERDGSRRRCPCHPMIIDGFPKAVVPSVPIYRLNRERKETYG